MTSAIITQTAPELISQASSALSTTQIASEVISQAASTLSTTQLVFEIISHTLPPPPKRIVLYVNT